MSNPTVENFFDNAVRAGAPGALLKTPGDQVSGQIVDQYLTDATDFATKKPILLEDGRTEQQLVLVLQTDLRNWQGVNKIPVEDPSVPNSPQKNPALDDGKRALHVRMYHNLHGALGKAILDATGEKQAAKNGATLGVKVYELEDTGKGNPLKKHQAYYVPPTAAPASEGFFPPQQQAPQPQQQPAPQQFNGPPAQQAPQYQAPPAPQNVGYPPPGSPAPQQDPWVTTTTTAPQHTQPQSAPDPFGAPPQPSPGFSMSNPPQPQERADQPPF